MPAALERCPRCGREIPSGGAVYSDHNRKFCSEECARAQLDAEQGIGSARAATPPLDMAGDRVPRGGGKATSRKRGPTRR